MLLQNPENIKGVYKRLLLKQMEVIDIDIQYKKLKMRKLELEIQQLQKNASRTTIFKKGKGKKNDLFDHFPQHLFVRFHP